MLTPNQLNHPIYIRDILRLNDAFNQSHKKLIVQVTSRISRTAKNCSDDTCSSVYRGTGTTITWESPDSLNPFKRRDSSARKCTERGDATGRGTGEEKKRWRGHRRGERAGGKEEVEERENRASCGWFTRSRRAKACLAFDTPPFLRIILRSQRASPFFRDSLQKHDGRSVQEWNGRPGAFFQAPSEDQWTTDGMEEKSHIRVPCKWA